MMFDFFRAVPRDKAFSDRAWNGIKRGPDQDHWASVMAAFLKQDMAIEVEYEWWVYNGGPIYSLLQTRGVFIETWRSRDGKSQYVIMTGERK